MLHIIQLLQSTPDISLQRLNTEMYVLCDNMKILNLQNMTTICLVDIEFSYLHLLHESVIYST